MNHYKYPDEVIDKLKEAVKVLRMAEIYAHRIDWVLSGDDGEETFLRRLNGAKDSYIQNLQEELAKIK